MTPQKRRPGSTGWLVASLVVAAAFLAAASDGPHVAATSGSVEIATGSPPVWRSAAAGDLLAPGDSVRTGHDGRAELVLGTGTVRLYPNSLLAVPEMGAGDDASERVRLERGRSLFDVLKRRNGRFEVETPEVVVSVKGTRFGVDVGGELAQVAVFRGLVGVRERSQTLAMETLVREGFAAVGGSEAPFELLLNAAPDPWDGWSAGRLDTMLENRAPVPIQPPAALRDGGLATQLAVAEARTAAREAAHPAVVEIAMERNPQLRERLAKLERQKQQPQALPLDEIEARAVRSRVRQNQLGKLRDTVADSPQLKKAIQTSLVESMVSGLPNDPTGAGSDPGLPPFEVELLGQQVSVMTGSSTYLFDLDDVMYVLQTGPTSLPPPLQSYLANSGVTPAEVQALFQQMASLLGI